MEESSQNNTLTRQPIETTTEEIKTQQSASSESREVTTNEVKSSDIEPTPSELIALGRPPLAAEILRIGPAYETFDIKEQIAEIDEFIRSEIDDDRKIYEQSIKGLLANIKQTDDIYVKVEQLRDYIRIQQKIRNVIKEKEEFEMKDPAEMTASQLKRFFKNNGTRRN